jgi:hypothetical protein
MSNMAHCRFTNTLEDLLDCQSALRELLDLDQLSAEERKSALSLIRISGDIYHEFADCLPNVVAPVQKDRK